jgi:hypothetical protein
MAIRFIKAHRDALRELADYPGVDTFILGIHVPIDLSTGVVGFCVGPSPQLMWHALDIRIHPTWYIDLDRSHESGPRYPDPSTGSEPPRTRRRFRAGRRR